MSQPQSVDVITCFEKNESATNHSEFYIFWKLKIGPIRLYHGYWEAFRSHLLWSINEIFFCKQVGLSLLYIFSLRSLCYLTVLSLQCLCIIVLYECDWMCMHYHDVIMSTIASQITGILSVYSAVCSSADQRKHQSSASLVFVSGIRQWPVNSLHKGPVTQKIFSFYDVIMELLDVSSKIMTCTVAIDRKGWV